jgi:hypothetical protein
MNVRAVVLRGICRYRYHHFGALLVKTLKSCFTKRMIIWMLVDTVRRLYIQDAFLASWKLRPGSNNSPAHTMRYQIEKPKRWTCR